MRANAVILIIIGLLFLVGTVGAVIQVDVTGNSSWLVAGSGSSAAYTLTVKNITSNVLIEGATITFSVDPVYGTMSSIPVTTDSNGKAVSTFTVGTKSGTAPILASISYSGSDGPFSITETIPQNIDHGSPFYDFTISPPLFTYPAQGTVNSQVPFKVAIFDKWGNPIDNRNPSYTHNVELHASSALSPTEPYFVVAGNKQDILGTLDSNGTFSVYVKLTTKSGDNKILMDNFEGKITSQIAWIKAMADVEPYSMTGTISHGGILPADNKAKFTLDYYLYDKYANPIGNSSIWINTNLSGETTPTQHFSDDTGLIKFYYGPKISILTANITAIANDTPSLKKNLIANFVSSGIGSDLILVVTPETMASGETDSSTTKQARVVGSMTDAWGNPVNGKEVTFKISNPLNENRTITGNPSFSCTPDSSSLCQSIAPDTIKATTDNGVAMVTFYPGSIITDTSDPGYSASATGSCVVDATYINSTTGNLYSTPVTVQWKNFAYLSVVVNVTPQTVHVNDTVDVTIQITGDGYSMVQNPITVVLDLDATSNLAATSDGTNLKTRWENAQNASVTFVNNMSTQDQVGLVTHGFWENIIYWQLVSNITYNRENVITGISNLTPSGGLGGNATTLKDSVFAAVDKIVNNPLRDPNEVPAIVTVGANSYAKNSDDRDQMVQATWTDNNIRVFSILYVSTLNSCLDTNDDVTNLRELTDATHGKFYCALSKLEVDEFLVDIYQNLSQIAGVNTSMDLDFQNVAYVYNNTTYSGNDTVSYIANGPFVNHTKDNIDSDGRTSIIWTDGNQSVVNQTDDWNDDFNLNFTIGTIHIKETWETTFRLRMNKEGIIDLFGPNSKISYNGGSGSLNLPATFIISVNETIPFGLQSGILSVTDLTPQSGNFNESVYMHWYLNYTGFDTVTETYWYSYRNQPFVQFGSTSNIPPTDGIEIPRSIDLDVTNFPAGDYEIKVIAYVAGIPPAEDSGAFTKPPKEGSVYIRLK
ncbi:MAG TPA: Ig-like domain-containing protein [Methanoregulaceae archaeon]|nr:Ig-like domain-containing protein [Methanoregulaceae archaeon]